MARSGAMIREEVVKGAETRALARTAHVIASEPHTHQFYGRTSVLWLRTFLVPHFDYVHRPVMP